MLDEAYAVRDFHSVVKPAIDDMMGCDVTFDILFHNSEHQATLFRYGVKKSLQVSGRKRFTGSNVGRATCVGVSDREGLQAHHAHLEEAVRREEAVKIDAWSGRRRPRPAVACAHPAAASLVCLVCTSRETYFSFQDTFST